MISTIKDIDLQNYARIAARMCPDISGLAICGKDGAVLVATDAHVEQLIARTQEQWQELPRPTQREYRVEAPGGEDLYFLGFPGNDDNETGTLVVTLRAEVNRDGSETAEVYDVLLPLCACLGNELNLNLELDAMAGELAERYEELNLVYHTDDQVSYFREGQEALLHLVQNCKDYLDVGFALLQLRDKGLHITSDAKGSNFDIHAITSALDNGIYEETIKRREALVLNGPGESGIGAIAGLPYKLLCCPIPGTGNKIDGVLVIFNELSGSDFSNSDKNLLSVMTKKAAKIVQGSYDGLTGLLNRCSFEHLLDNSLETLRNTTTEHCVIHVNIDQLHLINDTLGHEAGDAVIDVTANVILRELRDSDMVARLGGDEIGVLMCDCSLEQGQRIADKLRLAIQNENREWNGRLIDWTVSIGIAPMSGSKENAEQVIKNAALACDLAKERGRNRVQGYQHADTGMQEREQYMKMVGAVHEALREDRFTLFAQLIEPLTPENDWHMEVLLRMTGKSGEIIPPINFLPASERYQLMPEIDRWVIKHALEILSEHCLDPKKPLSLTCGINLSGQSLCDEGFLGFVQETLTNAEFPAEQVCFEITETAAVANIVQAKGFIGSLRQRGCRFALDDFGAGLSSFGYLKSFDIDYLKIDGALVRDIVDDPVTAAMVASVNQVGHVMGLKTIAEYVENTAIRAALMKLGVDFVQGHAIDKPRPLRDLLEGIQAKPAIGAK